MSIGAATPADYDEGFHMGCEWAEADIRNSQPSSHTLAMLAEEAQVATTRWGRTYYLGALRGYRSVIRTKRGQRWGT